MNADETKRTEEFIADDSEAEMTQPHPGEFPASYNECLYCGEPIPAPALYCCEEHEEGRRNVLLRHD